MLRAEVDAVVGTAETDAKLVDGLQALAEVGGRLLDSSDPRVRKRAAVAKVTTAYLVSVKRAGDTLAAAEKEFGAKAVTKPSQRALDVLDGVNLLLLNQILHAFEAAHDLDASIPRLVPSSTRRVLGRRVAKTRTEPAKPADPPKPVPA